MKNLFIFVIGTIIAGLTGYKIGRDSSKKKYESISDAEIDASKKLFRDHYEKKLAELGIQKETINKEEIKKPEIADKELDIKIDPKKGIDYGKRYRTTTEQDRIPGSPENNNKHLKKEEVDTTKPYIITQEEFDETNYQIVTLFYTLDKVLTDDDYNQLDNIGIVGGYPILDQMGMHEPSDCLYVRDEKNGIDYEILHEERVFNKLRSGAVVED